MGKHPAVAYDCYGAGQEQWQCYLHASELDWELCQICLAVALDRKVESLGMSPVVPVHEQAGGER